MLWSEAEAAIRSFVETAWAMTAFSSIPLVWENEISPPQSTFIVLDIAGVFAEGSIFGTTGKRLSIQRGLVFFHAFVPTGTGKLAALQQVVTMAGLLQLQTIGPGVINFNVANKISPVESGESADASITAAQPAGVYYRCSGSVPFILINQI